jgi:hypothetical protein
LVLGLAYAAFYRTMGNWQSLSRNSADIVRTMQAGERWRADVRSATAAPRVVESDQETTFHVPQAEGEILYAFRNGAVFRRAPSNLDWLPLLPKVKRSQMQIDQREHVTAWRWEVELQTAQTAAHVKPLFTFQAVTANKPRP